MRQLKINKSITPRSEQSLDKYLTEISRVPLVSTEEEDILPRLVASLWCLLKKKYYLPKPFMREARKVKWLKTSLSKPICALSYLLLNSIRTKVLPLLT